MSLGNVTLNISVVGNLLLFPLHGVLVEINSVHAVCITNETKYYTRLKNKGMQVAFNQIFTIFTMFGPSS